MYNTMGFIPVEEKQSFDTMVSKKIFQVKLLDKNHMIGNDRNKMDKNKLKLICIYVLHFNVFWF